MTPHSEVAGRGACPAPFDEAEAEFGYRDDQASAVTPQAFATPPHYERQQSGLQAFLNRNPWATIGLAVVSGAIAGLASTKKKRPDQAVSLGATTVRDRFADDQVDELSDGEELYGQDVEDEADNYYVMVPRQQYEELTAYDDEYDDGDDDAQESKPSWVTGVLTTVVSSALAGQHIQKSKEEQSLWKAVAFGAPHQKAAAHSALRQRGDIPQHSAPPANRPAGYSSQGSATPATKHPQGEPPEAVERPSKHRHHAGEKPSYWQLLKNTVTDFSNDKAPRLAAALAYYTIFSLAPILLITITVATWILGAEAVTGELERQLTDMIGAESAATVNDMIAAAQKSEGGIIATVVGVVALLFGASGVFTQLKDAMDTIWEVEPKPGRGIWGMIKDRFLSFAMVLSIGFVLLVSLVLTAVLEAATHMIGAEAWMQVLNIAVSAVVITILFALIFKYLPDVQVAWKDVLLGAFVTALLFVAGKYLLGLYLGNVSSGYGAAGSVLVILLWAYYASMILFLGAEFTQAYASMYGSRIQPSDEAMFVEKRQ